MSLGLPLNSTGAASTFGEFVSVVAICRSPRLLSATFRCLGCNAVLQNAWHPSGSAMSLTVPPGQFYRLFDSCDAMPQNEAGCCTYGNGPGRCGRDTSKFYILKVHVVTNGANDPKVWTPGLACGSLHSTHNRHKSHKYIDYTLYYTSFSSTHILIDPCQWKHKAPVAADRHALCC